MTRVITWQPPSPHHYVLKWSGVVRNNVEVRSISRAMTAAWVRLCGCQGVDCHEHAAPGSEAVRARAALGLNSKSTDDGQTYPSVIKPPPATAAVFQKLLSCSESCGSQDGGNGCQQQWKMKKKNQNKQRRETSRNCWIESSKRQIGVASNEGDSWRFHGRLKRWMMSGGKRQV